MRLISAVLFYLFLLASPAVRAQDTNTVPKDVSSGTSLTARTAGVPRDACFPLETLPAELRPKAEKLLLDLLDSEALYTVIGGMKPMSSGFASYRISLKTPEVAKLEEARQILATFRCGDVFQAELLPFHTVDKGTRYLEAVIFYRPALRQAISLYQGFFGPYGITPSTEPLSVFVSVEHDSTPARNRGLGYLYGYPAHAVDFFVAAAEEEKRTGKFVKRDFFQIPVFKAETGYFVYAVPKGYRPQATDLSLREKAVRILSAYRERRNRYIGDGKPGPAVLLRDWFDDGRGRCAPENARF